MTNLVVSRICNLACPFCFAEEYRNAGDGGFITEDAFVERLDFLQKSGMSEVRLIGGEPTLHPQFLKLVKYVQDRGMHLLVFTHGLMRKSILEYLATLPETTCTVLVNISAGKNLSERGRERQREVLRQLGQRASPGITIESPAFEVEQAISLVLETGCRKAIRLGLAQPDLTGTNRFLHPRQYPLVGSKIAFYAEIAARYDVHFEFDCGFVRCMFSEEEISTLAKTRTSFGWHCSPIPDIDIHEIAFPCFPLFGKFSTVWSADSRPGDIREELMRQMYPYRLAGIYPSCSLCNDKANEQCSGGCLSLVLHRFRPADLSPLESLFANISRESLFQKGVDHGK